MRWLLLALLLCVGACAPAGGDGLTTTPRKELSEWQPSGELDCTAELSADECTLLEPVDLIVRVQCPSEAELAITKQVFADFVSEVATEIAPRAPGFLHTIVFTLRPTSLGKDGELQIPSLKIEVGEETVTTPELTLKVRSALAEGDDKVALEAADALPPQLVWWPYAVAVLALLLAVVCVLWWRKRPRRDPALPVEVPIPAHVKALRALAKLRQAERGTEAEIEAFYVEVSQVLRVYLEERFGLHAPTRSTEEFLVELEAGEALEMAHRQSLRNFLQQCDLVKFARMFPGGDVHDQTLRVAETVVDETRPDRGALPSGAPASVGAGGEAS